jgi:hypothetical protein
VNALRNNGSEQKRAIKKIIAGVLFCSAVVFAFVQFSSPRPGSTPTPPESTKWLRYQNQRINEDFQADLDKLGLTSDQREQLVKWQQQMRNTKDPEKRKNLNRKIKDILHDDQLKRYRELVKERNDKRKALNQQRQLRLKRMVGGERELEKHKEDMKKVREQRQQRIEEQKNQQEQDAQNN